MSHDFANLTILTVDDNANMRRLVRSMLRGFGVGKVREAADGAAALSIIRANPNSIDIVICDWNMDGMNGHDFLKELRKDSQEPWAHMPVIMLTAHSEPSVIKLARDAGIDSFLRKPVIPKDMLTHIIQVLDKPKKFIVAKNYKGPDRRGRRNEEPSPGRRTEAVRREENAGTRRVVIID